MFDTVTIGEKQVPMLCLASTNIYFNKIFGVDPLALQSKKLTPAEGIDFATKMAFVMAKQAELKSERAAMLRLNEGDFIDWLDGFEAVDVQLALEAAMNVYRADSKETSTPKK